MDHGQEDWSLGSRLPLEKWLWLNCRGAFEDEKLSKFVPPFPPEELMLETEGFYDRRRFAKSGADIYRALVEASPRSLEKYGKILVLNCGCGRLLRFFKGHRAQIFGCDLDEKNIHWINASLPYVEARRMSLHSAFPFPDDFFEAIVAVSFFTSLDSKARELFLPELKRIASPNAHVFVSIHGEKALRRAEQEPEIGRMLGIEGISFEKKIEQFQDKGSFFFSKNVEDALADNIIRRLAEAFRLKKRSFVPGVSFVSKSHIMDNWQKWFDVIDVREGAIHDFQDIVVLNGKKHLRARSNDPENAPFGDVSANPKEATYGRKKQGTVWIDSIRLHKAEAEHICDFSLDNPASSGDIGGKPFGFSGWIVGKRGRFDSIDICSEGFRVLSIPVNVNRPDVAKHFKIAFGDDKYGFSAYFNPFHLPRQFEIEGFANSSDSGKIKLFSVVGGRTGFEEGSRLETSPLVVNTLGRTGSTYLLGLLGAHPQIAVYKPFQVEARYASYWTQIFLSLGHPKSWVFPVASYDNADPSWILGDDSGKQLHHAMYPEMSSWFNGCYTEELFRFCMNSLRQHYRRVAEIQKKKDPLFFGEKYLPNPFTDAVVDLLPGTKEIILVRDFRDMFCSIRAFNEKRGFLGFGRDKFSNDRDYIRCALAPGAKALFDSWKKRRIGSHLIEYEDLVANPESSLEKIFEFLGVEASTRTAKRVVGRAAKMNPKSQKQHKTTSRPGDSLRRYRREIDPDLLEFCNEAFGEYLAGFGYDV